MIQLLLVFHVLLALALIIVVLLQRSEGGALGIGGGGGGGGGMMSSRAQANFLTRATAVLAGLFMLNCLFLATLAGMDRRPRSILDGVSQPGTTESAVPSPIAPPIAPAAPSAPRAPAAPIAPPTQ